MSGPCRSPSTCDPFSCPNQLRPCIYQEDNDFGYDYSYDGDEYYDDGDEDVLSNDTCSSCINCDCMDFECCPPGECICGPDVFTSFLGPTADESILVGLQTFLGLTYKCPPGFPNPNAAKNCCGGSCPGATCANVDFCKMSPCLKNRPLSISNQPPMSLGSSSGYYPGSEYYINSGSEDNETEVMNVGINNFIPCPIKRFQRPRISPCPGRQKRRRRQRPIIRPNIICGPPVAGRPKYYCYSSHKPSDHNLPSDLPKSTKSFKSLRSVASGVQVKKSCKNKKKRTSSTESENSNLSGKKPPQSTHQLTPEAFLHNQYSQLSVSHQPHVARSAAHHLHQQQSTAHSLHQQQSGFRQPHVSASGVSHHSHHPKSMKSLRSQHSARSARSSRSRRKSLQKDKLEQTGPSRSSLRLSQHSTHRRSSGAGAENAVDDPRVNPLLRRLSQHECPSKTDVQAFKDRMLASEARKMSRSGIDLDKRVSRRSLLDASRRKSRESIRLKGSREDLHHRLSQSNETKESKSTTCTVGCLCTAQQTAPITCEKLAQTNSAVKMSGPICCKCLNTMPRSGATCICSSPTTYTCTDYSLSQRKAPCLRQSKLSCCACNRATDSYPFAYDKMPSVCICENQAEKSSTPQSICICGSSKASYSCECGSAESPCVCRQNTKKAADFIPDKPDCNKHSLCWCTKNDVNESMVSRPTTCLCATDTDATPTRQLSNCLCENTNPCECIDVVGIGDTNKCDVRFAITKITKFDNYTTFEVMKSTKKKPKCIPTLLEGVFVLKNK